MHTIESTTATVEPAKFCPKRVTCTVKSASLLVQLASGIPKLLYATSEPTTASMELTTASMEPTTASLNLASATVKLSSGLLYCFTCNADSTTAGIKLVSTSVNSGTGCLDSSKAMPDPLNQSIEYEYTKEKGEMPMNKRPIRLVNGEERVSVMQIHV